MKIKLTIIRNYFILTCILFSTSITAQINSGTELRPYIEVTGSADMEIVPDEIYINIVIREKYINKEKITIESQEEKLKKYLKEIGIDLNDLYLADANADYVKIRRKTKDVLTKKEYTLKVGSAKILGQVFQQLDKLEITDAYISRVHHSKLDSLKKQVKILAIKAAKNKADYLLNALGKKSGDPLIVQDNERGVTPYYANARVMSMESQDKASGQEDDLEFKKIKIEEFIFVRFAIQ
jgi:uncharacterized protein